MSETAERLKPALAALSALEREELAQFLIDSLAADNEDGDDAELVAMLSRRLEDIRSGREAGVPAEEVFRAARELYP